MDERWMKEALKEALLADQKGEVPVGAVLVFENKVIAKGHNLVETLQDPTAHAEILCITAGANFFSNWRLLSTTLYTTLEPCPMCAGALFSARISRVVWAAPDIRLGANGSFIDLFSLKHPMHSIEVTSGVCEEESRCLLQQFFEKVRACKKILSKN